MNIRKAIQRVLPEFCKRTSESAGMSKTKEYTLHAFCSVDFAVSY